MKTIGLIGGMSWESSLEYYRIINEGVKKRLGGFHSAKCLLYSVDFAEIEAHQTLGQWDEAGHLLSTAAKALECGGADCIVLCTNTMHKVANAIESAVHIPLLHIVDATAQEVCSRGISRVGLLGTRFTMEEPFYKDRLRSLFGLEVLVPQPEDQRVVDRVIFDELVFGKINVSSRQKYLEIIQEFAVQGTQGVILGCTEIGLLLKQADSELLLFDTTELHAEAALDFALE